MTAVHIVSFMLIFLKLDHPCITADLLNQNPTKKVMLKKPIPTDNLTKYKTKNKLNINIVET